MSDDKVEAMRRLREELAKGEASPIAPPGTFDRVMKRLREEEAGAVLTPEGLAQLEATVEELRARVVRATDAFEQLAQRIEKLDTGGPYARAIREVIAGLEKP